MINKISIDENNIKNIKSVIRATEFLNGIVDLIFKSKTSDIVYYESQDGNYAAGKTIVVTCMSQRHISSLVEDVRFLAKKYIPHDKMKYGFVTDNNGASASKTGWSVVDIPSEDLLIHFFLEETRQNIVFPIDPKVKMTSDVDLTVNG